MLRERSDWGERGDGARPLRDFMRIESDYRHVLLLNRHKARDDAVRMARSVPCPDVIE